MISLLQKQWESYRDLTFPDGAGVEQNDLAYQSFVAGVNEAFMTIRMLGEMGDKGVAGIELYQVEIGGALAKIHRTGEGEPLTGGELA